MTNYVGLDVSQKTTTLCIVDVEGHRQWRGECVTSPEQIVQAVLQHAHAEVSMGVETGPMMPWLVHELRSRGLDVICLDARLLKTFGMLPGSVLGRSFAERVEILIAERPDVAPIVRPTRQLRGHKQTSASSRSWRKGKTGSLAQTKDRHAAVLRVLILDQAAANGPGRWLPAEPSQAPVQCSTFRPSGWAGIL